IRARNVTGVQTCALPIYRPVGRQAQCDARLLSWKRIENVGEAHRAVETFDVGPVSGGAVVPRSGDVAWFDRQVEVPGEVEPGGWRFRTPQAATHPAEPEAGKALASSKQHGVGADAVEDES